MNRKQSFTLIELMVVMAILAILMGIGAGAFTTSMKKGRDATRKANLRAITNALDLYYNDNGRYPSDDGSGGIKGCLGGVGLSPTPAPGACTVNGAFQDVNGTLYMQQLPTDPVGTQNYYYVSATGAQYQIYTHLENSQDPTRITPAASPTDCGTNGTCNWGLSSTNTNP